MKFCIDIDNTNLKRSNHSELWIRLLFLLNGKNCFFADEVIQSNLQNAKKLKLNISHTFNSRWIKLAVFSDTSLKNFWSVQNFCLAFHFHFRRWPQIALWAMRFASYDMRLFHKTSTSCFLFAGTYWWWKNNSIILFPFTTALAVVVTYVHVDVSLKKWFIRCNSNLRLHLHKTRSD